LLTVDNWSRAASDLFTDLRATAPAAGSQRAPNSINLDQMFRRPCDKQFLQGHMAGIHD
jgi:hypothetical protein